MRNIRRWALFALLLIPFAAFAQALSPFNGGVSQPEFLEAREVFTIESVQAADGATRVRGVIAPGYYLYRHRLKLEAGGVEVPMALPPGLPQTDEFFGDTEVYRDGIDIEIEAAPAGAATLHWQGCADAGICYPPQRLELELPASGAGTAASGAAAQAAGAPSDLAEDQAFAQRLSDSGLAAAALVFFGLGLLLAFTPCTLPMVPIVSSLVLGGHPTPRRALGLSAAYVLPMALTYAALGVAAGLSGANLQAALQNPWLLGGFAVLFALLALSMFGAFELQLPAWLSERLDRASRGRAGGTVAGAATMGVLSALLVGPCMTAPLAGALLYIGQAGNPVTGGVALFALGLGMGLPLLLIAMFGARVLPKPGVWMVRVKAAFGFVLLALAVSTLGRAVAAPVAVALWGAWLLAVATGLMALAVQAGPGLLQRWGPRGAAAISAVWGVAMMLGGASGAEDPWRPLQSWAGGGAAASPVSLAGAPVPDYVQVKTRQDVAQRLAAAGARGEWTLVDFYADWCVSCHVIEREVFGDPEVAATLARMQVLRPDVTANDAADQALMREWAVAGPPTLLLIGPDGRERRELRTVGEIEAGAFLERLQRAGAGEA